MAQDYKMVVLTYSNDGESMNAHPQHNIRFYRSRSACKCSKL